MSGQYFGTRPVVWLPVFAVPARAAASSSMIRGSLLQVLPARTVLAAETREVKVAFLGGLFGGGGAAIDDSKPYICVDCGYSTAPSKAT